MPMSRRQRTMTSAGTPMLTPSASSTSALPQLAGHAAVAVLGHDHPRARDHEGGRGGDVEGVQAVAAGAAGVHDGAGRGLRTAVNFSRMARARCRR
jgi:hypothetical protein